MTVTKAVGALVAPGEQGFTVGNNEPYTGALESDTCTSMAPCAAAACLDRSTAGFDRRRQAAQEFALPQTGRGHGRH
jgi:hypothetical protein